MTHPTPGPDASTTAAAAPDATTDVEPSASEIATPLEAGRVVRASGIVAAVVATLYVWRASATPYLLDSTELVATTASLGVSHPPGHPAFHLLAAGLTPVPIGTAAFRVTLFVALCSAACLGLLPFAAWRAGWLRTRGHLAFASVVAVTLAFTSAFAQQSIRAEVYSLNVLLIAVASVFVMSARTRAATASAAGLAAVALGVGLLNHHYLIVAAFPAFALGLLLAPGAARFRRLAVGAAFGAACLLGYAYLPARGIARPAVSWGWPTSLPDIWWTISAQAFQKTAARAASIDPGESFVNVIGVLGESLTFPGFLLAAGGLLALALRDRRLGVFLVCGVVCNLATQVAFGFDPMNPDALGYFMPTYWWLGLGLVWLVCSVELPGRLAARTGLARIGLAVVLLVGVALTARSGPRTVTLANYWDSELLRDEGVNGLAPESMWITAYFETGFNTWYGRAVEDRRPDVTHLHQSFLTYPFYEEMVDDEGASHLLATPDAGGLLDLAALIEHAEHSDVRIEPEQLVTVELAAHSVPTRLTLQLLPSPVAQGELPPSLAQEAVANARAVALRFSDPPELQTGRYLLWGYFNLSGQLYRSGRVRAARGVLGAALELSPNDPDLRAFATQLDRELARSPSRTP